jgi:hypothetical protein
MCHTNDIGLRDPNMVRAFGNKESWLSGDMECISQESA